PFEEPVRPIDPLLGQRCGHRHEPVGRRHAAMLRCRPMTFLTRSAVAVAACLAFIAYPAAMRSRAAPPAGGPFDALHFRDIGPAATGGRIHDLQIDPANPAVLYAASASGRIRKTSKQGL